MNDKIKQVKGYMTTDFQIFNNPTIASTHQDSIDFDEGLRKFVNTEFASSIDSEDEMFEFLKEHRSVLTSIFSKG